MAFDISAHLEKAKLIHRLPSDYKLALVMGVSHSALTNYRQGKTLPDARVISILCDLTGEDSGLMLAQVEEMRAKTSEARAIWHQIAERLQAGAATAIFSVCFLVAGWAGFPMSEAAAQASRDNFISYTSWNVWRRFRRKCMSLIRHLGFASSRIFSRRYHVQSPRTTARA